MKKKHLISYVLFLFVNLVVFAQPAHNKKVVGYYASWAIYTRDYNIPNIDGDKLTHLMYAFFEAVYDPLNEEDTKVVSLDSYADYDHMEGGILYDSKLKGNFYDLKKLKEKYPHLKILISIGGWTKSHALPAIAASPVASRALAQSMVAFMKSYPFIDGFDIDWEFPVKGGTDGTEKINRVRIPEQPHTTKDHINLVSLLKIMRQEMPHKLISIAAGNSVKDVSSQFIGPNNRGKYGLTDDISTYCDFITFFGYDFGGNWEDKTCYNAPLYGSGAPEDPLHRTPVQSLDVLVDILLTEIGFPADKLIMGVPFYGKLFKGLSGKGKNPELPGLFVSAPRVKGSCAPQPPKGTWDENYCENSGSIEFCDLAGSVGTNPHHYLNPLNSGEVNARSAAAGWVRYWDNVAKVPYLYNASLSEFITYDDRQSIDEKMKFINSKNLAGAMIWELSQDVRGVTSKSLLNQINTSFETIPVKITVNFSGSSHKSIPDVLVQLIAKDGTIVANETSDINGVVVFSDVVSYTPYTVKYSKNTYSFLPNSILIQGSDLGSNVSYKVLGANQTISISGAVKKEGSLVSNVKIVLQDSEGKVLEAVTSIDGNFLIENIISGLSYRLTAEKDYYTFGTVNLKNISTDQTDVFVTGMAAKHIISGVVKEGGVALSGIRITATGAGRSYADVSGSDGAYAILDLPAGISYEVAVSNSAKNFLPKITVYKNLNENKVLNFTLNVAKISGTIKEGTKGVSGTVVELEFNWQDSAHLYKKLTAISDADGKYHFNNSDIDGYKEVSSLDLNNWKNKGKRYSPTAYKGFKLPMSAQSYDFNSEPRVLNLDSSLAKISGTIKEGAKGVSGAVVVLTFHWQDSTHDFKKITATADVDGKYHFNNSDIDGYKEVFSIKLKDGKKYFPKMYKKFKLSTSSQSYDFNSNIVEPTVVIASSNVLNVAVEQRDSVKFKASVRLTYDDESTSISSVVFNIDGHDVTAVKATGDFYTASWTPVVDDFNKEHTLKVTATASNKTAATDTYVFHLKCSGNACPNQLPKITLLNPTQTRINQSGGFRPVPINVDVTDVDGSVRSVYVSIDGGAFRRMKVEENEMYSYSFTPTNYQDYLIIIKAIDNTGAEKRLSKTLKIIKSSFTPLPENVIVGYAHSWNIAGAPFLYFNEISDKYNVVMYSFIETKNRDGFTPKLTIETSKYSKEGRFDPLLLKADIATLKNKGVPVIVSIGGQNSHVELNTEEEKNIFVNGLKEIIDEYGFDGVDLDFEGASMNFGAGGLKDFSYKAISAYPKLKNIIDAFVELDAYYGEGFLITAAPETLYVQTGFSTYSDRAGSFLPVIHNLRDQLDLVMVQLYNTGSVNALDRVAYHQGTLDFMVSMPDMLINGFDVAQTGVHFKGLPASKVVIGIPSCKKAAAVKSYIAPERVVKALDYLRFGTVSSDINYKLHGGKHPRLRGVMTWSVNWDASPSCASAYEFANAYDTYFFGADDIKAMVGISDPNFTKVVEGDSLILKASISIANNDGSASISSVVFNIDGRDVTADKATGDFYTASWTPVADDFNKEHILKVTATVSNKTAATGTHTFSLNKLEDTTSSQAGACSVPAWYAGRAYDKEDYVSYNGMFYMSKGWIVKSESVPFNNKKWKLEGDCNLKKVPLTTDCGLARSWDATVTNYKKSERVLYKNGLYRAKYWIAGKEHPDMNAAYEFIGVCVAPPEIISVYSNATTIIQSSIGNVLINAKVLDFGFDLLEVNFMVKEKGTSTYTKHTMKNSGGDLYTFSWAPPSYGDFEIMIKAKNWVDVSSEMISTIKIALNTPPIVRLDAPKEGSEFIQLNFEPIKIVFTATKTAKKISKIWVNDITASTSNSIPVVEQNKNQYTYQWTPSSYEENTLEVVVEDVLGTSTTIDFSCTLVDPSKEKVSFASLPNQIKGVKGVTKVFTFDENITKILSRRVDLCTLTVSGNTLTVSNSKAGRTGLEITTDKGSYYVGLRIDKENGEVVGLPEYLSMGSVSEDIDGDIKFWRDLDNTNLLKNKRMDIRYIYINGGPGEFGWKNSDPNRVLQFTRNSLKLGIIPLFVFYNIPDGGESHGRNIKHIKDPKYMKAYFKNLSLFFDYVKQEVGDEMFMIILEPDFLGYMQQYKEKAILSTSVGLESIGENAGTLQTLVQRINMEINNRRKKDNLNFIYGWQYNLWARPNVGGNKGIVRKTDNNNFTDQLEIIKQTGAEIAQYGMDLGTLSHDADFISIDKYGLDAVGYPTGGKDPGGYTWFWNNDHWLNYLALVKSMSETAKKHVILWQLPVGHINGSQVVSEYTNNTFPLLANQPKKYEDSAATFFFGDDLDFSEKPDRFSYFSQNKHKDPKLKVDEATKHVTFGNHFEEANKSGVRVVLMGAGVGISTDGVGAPPTDDYYWIQKVQGYYLNQMVTDKVDTDKDGVFDSLDKCLDTPRGEKVNSKGCSESQLDADKDGVPNSIDECPNTLLGEMVNKKGCVDNQQDADNDGVVNASDQYPGTPKGALVDRNGGVILKRTAFSLSQTGITCSGKNNGTITLANTSPYRFDIQWTGPNNTTSTLDDVLAANGSYTIFNLPSGEYHLTMKFDKDLGMEINAHVIHVSDTPKISVNILNTNKVDKTITVEVQNATVYHVKLNDHHLKTVNFKSTDRREIVIPLQEGKNHIQISSDVACRGTVDKWITIAGSVDFYPNPTVGNVFVRGLSPGLIYIEITTLSGKVIKEITKKSADGTLELSVVYSPDGVYIVHLSGPENINITPFKIVKN